PASHARHRGQGGPPGHPRHAVQGPAPRDGRGGPMKVHHLRPAEGAKTERTRVGRGRAGTRGKTAGRGTKGTGARKNVSPHFEGGQMPYQRRVPKLKGFSNPNRVEFTPVNVEVLERYFDGEVTPAALVAHGLAHKGRP